MKAFAYDKDSDGIVTITMDMTGRVNSMNAEYREAMAQAVQSLECESSLTGVVVTSAKDTFFAGGDLNELVGIGKGDEARFMALAEATKEVLRRLEKLTVPVVAAINGAALGGGLEICLACNYRMAWNDNSVKLGLPEVTLGLLPGGGGIVRMVNLLGLEAALPYLLEGKKIRSAAAVDAGIIDETVDQAEQLLPRAKSWILENQQGAALQPWDVKGHRIPGGSVNSPKLAQLIAGAPAMLFKKTRGLLPAPEKILDCAIEAARLDFDTALRVETRAFIGLLTTPQAKNMITAFFFQMNQINHGASRPKGIQAQQIKRVGILGAGMMGQGIAYVSAVAGIEVVLKDIDLEAAEKGKSYSRRLLDRAVERGRINAETGEAVFARITATDNDANLESCDLIIEAVFENIELKNKITAALEPRLAETSTWGTNTSSLPITRLAQASERPENFIGIHFFSPVDKMPLVEIICGEKTSDITLARAFDYAKQIRKTPIVVNDSLGFFTSRTFSTYLDEGVRLLNEGVDPTRIDNLGKAVGMPVGPLAIYDEVSLELSRKMFETWDAMGEKDVWGERDAMRDVLSTMVGKHGRGGRHHGGGFYDYHENGSKSIWPQLYELYFDSRYSIGDDDIKDRLLFRQVIEALKCLESGVLRSTADGNIGSIMGIGAPAWTGGLIQFVNTFGLQPFVDRCDELAGCFGERFLAPQIVQQKLAEQSLFL